VGETLLSIHLLSAVVWLGAGLYDFLITSEIALAAGQPAELPLIRIHLRYGPVIAMAMFLVLISGILMSELLGWGIFTFDLARDQAVHYACNTHRASPVRSAHREACWCG
jgi:uncharacterized membrane protein